MTWERYTTSLEDNITHFTLRAQALEAGEKSSPVGGTVEDRVAIHPKDRRQADRKVDEEVKVKIVISVIQELAQEAART